MRRKRRRRRRRCGGGDSGDGGGKEMDTEKEAVAPFLAWGEVSPFLERGG